MRISADTAVCEGHAMCFAAAPDVFDVSEDDKVVVLDAAPPESLRGDVERAAMVCPVQAIKVRAGDAA